MPGIFGDDFPSLLSPMATAQYRPTPTAAFPNPAAPAPGPLAIPPAQPPIFLSPPNSAGGAPAQPASPWDSIISGLNHHALTLMALGAGIAQGGVGRGLAGAATAAESERNRQVQQLNFLQTYKALTDGGVPPQEAQAAVGNPSLMRTLAARYLGTRAADNTAAGLVRHPTSGTDSPAVPPMPPSVPPGSAYVPAGWRAPDGATFDEQGAPR
jgi:hypothetical protein